MGTPRITVSGRRVDRLALNGLRVILAAAFVSLGSGFLMMPEVAAELSRAGFGRDFRLLLAASHVAVGLALLIPRLAAGTTLVLGSLLVWFTASQLPWTRGHVSAVPVALTLALVAFTAGYTLRRRAEANAWRAMLDRFAARG